MKNRVYELISILGLILIMVSCGGSGDTPSPEPPAPIELETPKILSPQKDAVCQGTLENGGSYTVSVRSSAVYGAVKYIFSLKDSQGKTVKPDYESKTPEGSFSEVPAGHAYTVMVTVLNSAGDSKKSLLTPFSTPGLKVVDYVPVVKSIAYDKSKDNLGVVFHDKESQSEDMLTYSVYYSLTKSFTSEDKKLLVENAEASSNKQVYIDLSKSNNAPYYRLEVKDVAGNMSSNDVHIVR